MAAEITLIVVQPQGLFQVEFHACIFKGLIDFGGTGHGNVIVFNKSITKQMAVLYEFAPDSHRETPFLQAGFRGLWL